MVVNSSFSIKTHQIARSMGLEGESDSDSDSDSKDEYVNKVTNEQGNHLEKGKYGPRTNAYSPHPGKYNTVGSSRSGTTIDWDETDGYQRSIWHKEGAHSTYSDKLPTHDTPWVTVENTKDTFEYPSASLGPSGKPWGQQTPASGFTQFPAELPTLANSTDYNPRVIRSRRHSSDNYETNQYNSSHHNQPSTRRLSFDPVRNDAARNPLAHTSSHAIPARKPLPNSRIQRPRIGAVEYEHSSPRLQAERARINRQNEEEILREREQRKLVNRPQENKKPYESYSDEAARIRRRDEEELLREREERKLKDNHQSKYQAPAIVPPKLPLDLPRRPSVRSRPATSPPSISFPIIPHIPTEDFVPHNSWPGNVNSAPYPRSTRRNSVSSSAGKKSPPYPVTPDNYHLKGYNNQNDIQQRAIHNAIKHEIMHGHKRIAAPTPPTFRSSYPNAVELPADNSQMSRDPTSRLHAPGGRAKLPCIKERAELDGESRRTEGIGDGREKLPEIRVQKSTPGTSVSGHTGNGSNTGRTRTSGDTERLTVPGAWKW